MRAVLTLCLVAVLAVEMTLPGGTFPLPGGTALAQVNGSTSQLVIESISFKVQGTQQGCEDPSCQNPVSLWGTIFVNASSPLSTLDLTVDGMPDGSIEWNLASPAFTNQVCSGTVAPISCTDIVTPNTNTLTARATSFAYSLNGGVNGNPVFTAGTTYEVNLVATFQDGSHATASASVIAVSVSGLPVDWYFLPLSLLIVSLGAVALVVYLLRRRVTSSPEPIPAPAQP